MQIKINAYTKHVERNRKLHTSHYKYATIQIGLHINACPWSNVHKDTIHHRYKEYTHNF